MESITDQNTSNELPVSDVGGKWTQPRRVCHISMCLLTGGLERLLVEFSRFHSSREFSMQFVALSELGRPAEEIQENGCPTKSLGIEKIGRIARIRRLADDLRSFQCDIVHTHNTYAHFYGTMAAKLAGVPVVINTQHGRGCGIGWKNRLLFQIANRFTNRIIGVSEDSATLCRIADRWSAKKISHIWNGIDLDRFQYRGPSDKMVAISVARLSPEKDFTTLLRAMDLAVKKVPNLHLQLVGDGPERRKLQQLADKLNLNDSVTFLGERSDVPELLSKAGFFVSSSRSEGISLTLLEAMAVGLPIVTTRVGGNPEIVKDGVTGTLCESGDVEGLAAQLIGMCGNRELWSSMGALGRQRVEDNFEVGAMVRQYERLYDELCPVQLDDLQTSQSIASTASLEPLNS